MDLFSAFQSHRDEFDKTHHGSITHDALAGAIAFEAAKAYENHLKKNGEPTSHTKAKELLAGFAAVAATHLIETKGLDAWDAHKQAQAEKQAVERVSETISVEEEYVS